MTRISLRERDAVAALAQLRDPDAIRAEMRYEQEATSPRWSLARWRFRRAAEKAARRALGEGSR